MLAAAVLADGVAPGEAVSVGLGVTVGELLGVGVALGLLVTIGPVVARGVQVGTGAAWCLLPFARALGELPGELGATPPGILLRVAPGADGAPADGLWLPPVSRLMSVTVCRS